MPFVDGAGEQASDDDTANDAAPEAEALVDAVALTETLVVASAEVDVLTEGAPDSDAEGERDGEKLLVVESERVGGAEDETEALKLSEAIGEAEAEGAIDGESVVLGVTAGKLCTIWPPRGARGSGRSAAGGSMKLRLVLRKRRALMSARSFA